MSAGQGVSKRRGHAMSDEQQISLFEQIRHEDEDGNEYWSARELGRALGYTEYGKFRNAIQKAESACENSGQAVSDHFAHMSDMIEIGKGVKNADSMCATS